MRIRYLLLHAYGTGGTIRTVFNQANSMAAAGHEVQVVSAVRKRDELKFPLDSRVRVTTLVDERGTGADGVTRVDGAAVEDRARFRTYRHGLLTRRGPKIVPRGETRSHYFTRQVERALVGWLRELRGGVLVTTRPGLNLIAAQHTARGVVTVAQEHMNLSTHKPDIRAAIARHYHRFAALAVLTRGDQEEYQRLLPGTRVVCVPNAVHAARQRPTTYANRIVVAAGRFVAQKGFDLLIPAFAQTVREHPDWELRIFGSGELKDKLRALIDKHHLYNNVWLMGFTPDLDEELAKASLYVLSSRFEGLPMVMIEAMSHALPVVSFDCPTGPADVITDGHDGLLVPPRNVGALAEAMGLLMADEGLRADMGAAALDRARSAYAPDAVRPQWEALFRELGGASEPPPDVGGSVVPEPTTG